ncbi:uncharacterized protein KD926_003364 [Aspergillus affinis]|uniref:uncharacterized protein n=1 Tax=Aspergillus affinis TaxID=1070780 RepID=UPI0022FE56FF|nr:uncharacterized protein KD926_003364 [Aspergillus affinis]KAI9043594.1 hypothetical protein KD926_003364 [Aspergillus affinis]
MSDVTPGSAGRIIDDIRLSNGGISDEDRAATPAGVLRALGNVREDLFSKIAPIVDPLKRLNLIVNLISRTSLLTYDRAEARGETPFLEFTLEKDCLMIDSNDNGYCAEDIWELCRSFKARRVLFDKEQILSAFKIGTKVHIRSGQFSFSFQHTQGNNRMDKFTPNREKPESLPPTVYSRITISCLYPGQFERLANCFRGIRTDGLLLFNSKCTLLHFTFAPPHANPAQVQYQIMRQKNKMTLTRTSEAVPSEHVLLRQSYHVFSREVNKSSGGLFGQRCDNTIYLAFPVDQESKVLLGPGGYLIDEVNCVLLPSNNQFNFILCVKSQHVNVQQAPDVLAESISIFICERMAFLSSLEPMEYEWVQYIPKADIVNKKWKAMLNHFYSRLKECKVFKSESGKNMHISSLRYLEPEHCDLHGKPLFPDLDQEIYLSTRYNPYLEFLKPLGLRRISNEELFDRIKAYYRPETRTFNPSRHDWSARVARLLTSWLADDNRSTLATGIKELKFLFSLDGPVLRGAECVVNPQSAESFQRRDVWLAFDTNGNSVPALPNICRIYDDCPRDSESTRLYNLLGIHYPHPEQVMDKIKAWNHSSGFNISVLQSRDVLHYIHVNTAGDAGSKAPCLPMVDERNKTVLTRGKMTQCDCYLWTDVYFPSDQAYGINEIAKKLSGLDFALRIHVLNADLLHTSQIWGRDKAISSPEWVSWLENVALVRRVPRLQNRQDPNRLSEIFESIIKYYPGMFLDVLRSHWATYKSELVPGLVSTIKATPVPTLDGERLISECYMLTPELRAIALKIHRTTMHLPFLLLSEGFAEQVQSRWGFLSVFDVVMEPTPKFFVGIYNQIVRKTPLNDAASEFQALYSILSERPVHDRLSFFKATNAIYVPHEKGDAKLVPIQDCLWDGPCWLQASYVLSFVKEYSESPQMKTMLTGMLNTTEARLETYIKELLYQQGLGTASLPQIGRIYARLSEGIMGEADLTSMRVLFKKHKLVYDPNSLKWHTPQECVWGVSADEGKISIGHYYPVFRDLFVARLLIEDSIIPSYISELRETVDRNDSSLDDLLSVMHKIKDLLLSPSDISSLLRIKFLPIAGANQAHHYYASPRDDFFIVDRDGGPCNFRGIVPTLRFSIDQVQLIRSFLFRLGLKDRFIAAGGLKRTFVSEERIKGLPYLTCDFQDRASALCRCAMFYAGAKAEQQQELYDVFRASLIYESPDIIARYIIPTADGSTKSIYIPARLHVQYENGELQLVVPTDITERQICFATQLPEALACLFSTNSPEARRTFTTVLGEPIDALDDILDSYGIPELSEVYIDAAVSREPEVSKEEPAGTGSSRDTTLTDELNDLVVLMNLDTDPEDSFESD